MAKMLCQCEQYKKIVDEICHLLLLKSGVYLTLTVHVPSRWPGCCHLTESSALLAVQPEPSHM